MSPLGWHRLHLVDNTDTQYLGDQNWQECWGFRLCFFSVSICLSMCQSVCVSVHHFKINLKFLKTHSYWLAQLLHVSLVLGLELKICRMHIMGEVLLSGFGTKSLFSNLNSYCYYDYYVSNSVIRVVVKFFWLTKIIFQVFCVFLKN